MERFVLDLLFININLMRIFFKFIYIYINISYYLYILMGDMRLKLSLWSKISKDLGIEDIILHQVIGTWIFPWIRHYKFDFLDVKNK